MTAPAHDDRFPIARCAPCGRDVLTHAEVDARGDERRQCVHCDAELDPDEVRWVEESELDRLGYHTYGDPEAGGCGRPGCGQGRCGRGGA